MYLSFFFAVLQFIVELYHNLFLHFLMMDTYVISAVRKKAAMNILCVYLTYDFLSFFITFNWCVIDI